MATNKNPKNIKKKKNISEKGSTKDSKATVKSSKAKKTKSSKSKTPKKKTTKSVKSTGKSSETKKSSTSKVSKKTGGKKSSKKDNKALVGTSDVKKTTASKSETPKKGATKSVKSAENKVNKEKKSYSSNVSRKTGPLKKIYVKKSPDRINDLEKNSYILFIRDIFKRGNKLDRWWNLNKEIFLKKLLIFTLITGSVFGFFYFYMFSPQPIPDQEVDRRIEEVIKKNKENISNGEVDLEDDGFELSANVLLIPKIGVEVGIFAGGEEALEKGIWHRYSDRSNPEKEGNFVLSGHRLSIGLTPQQTRRKSPLININKLIIGDIIYVIWGVDVYEYEIYDIFWVEPTAVEIERDDYGDVMTLYTCDLGGADSGRVVLRAKVVD